MKVIGICLQLRDFLAPLKLSNQQLCKVMKLFEEALNKGLGADTHAEASVKCYQTYIQDLPTGKGNPIFLKICTYDLLLCNLFLIRGKIDLKKKLKFRMMKDRHKSQIL